MTLLIAWTRRAPRLLLPGTVALLVLAAVVELFGPDAVHERIMRPAGLILLLATALWARAMLAASRGRRELARELEQHRKTVEALARSEERRRLAHDVARIGTWEMDDVVRRTSTWSPSLRELYGVGGDVPASFDSFLQLVHPDDRQHVVEAVQQALEEGGDYEFEHRIRRPDGEVLWLLSRGRVLTDEQGAPVRVLGVAMDVTEAKDAEAKHEKLEHQLRQAQKLEAVGRLAGGVAHDFNNLLLAIRGYTEIALRAGARGEDTRDEIEQIQSAADRAAALTSQLLAFSRQQVLRPQVLDLNDVVGGMEKLLRRLIGEDVDLEAVVADEPVCVDADLGQLEQVLANLAVNARDAMPRGGRLVLEVSSVALGDEAATDLPPGRYAVLAVSDTGCGMDAETAAQIFEPFFTTKSDGTGLGLATVHGIVQQSGGSIWVSSEPGAGTTFRVHLPLVEQRAIAPPRAVPASCGESGGETILLVEDDRQVRRVVAEMLGDRGYSVLEASSGEEALRLADPQNGRVDLLLSDLVMPGMGGREIAERFKKLHPAAPVLYMSGYTDDAVVRRGVLDRSAAFIEKPFGSDDLARRVRQLLDGELAGTERRRRGVSLVA